MQTIRKYRNATGGHGYRINGKLPVPPAEYAQFLKMELNWARQKESYVKSEILKRYKPFNKKSFHSSHSNGSHSHSSNHQSSQTSTKAKLSSSLILLLVQCFLFGIYLFMVGLSDADIEGFPIQCITGLIAVGLFFVGFLVIKWMNSELIIGAFKLGSFLLLFGILANTVLSLSLRDSYALVFPFVALLCGVNAIVCAKISFEKSKIGFGVFNIIEIATSLCFFAFGFISLINDSYLDWEILKWEIALFLLCSFALVCFVIWLLTKEASLSVEKAVGSLLLALTLSLNFIFGLIFGEDYRVIFYCLTLAIITYGIILIIHIKNHNSRRIRQLHARLVVFEIIICIALAVIFSLVTLA